MLSILNILYIIYRLNIKIITRLFTILYKKIIILISFIIFLASARSINLLYIAVYSL